MTPLLRQPHWLQMEQRVTITAAMFACQCIRGVAPYLYLPDNLLAVADMPGLSCQSRTRFPIPGLKIFLSRYLIWITLHIVCLLLNSTQIVELKILFMCTCLYCPCTVNSQQTKSGVYNILLLFKNLKTANDYLTCSISIAISNISHIKCDCNALRLSRLLSARLRTASLSVFSSRRQDRSRKKPTIVQYINSLNKRLIVNVLLIHTCDVYHCLTRYVLFHAVFLRL